MADEHPFLEASRLAAAGAFVELEYLEIEEPRGLYVRLILQEPPLIFKRDADHGTNIDRVSMPYHDRINIEEDVIQAGAEAILDFIRKAVARHSAMKR